ncbi:Myelin-associated oligodendrocyte basic protein isoform 2 [Theobroma cacao]|uniref:Myelin-associated oligodendrocyte basic protein isoform 2 n=1 Tax=Theobroma cacao TaxID=3641 RepID=A0A061F388_THECC|nr:Myelin-associated oligodendrocyte basic protein isoform 2 [Theobroma cacao]
MATTASSLLQSNPLKLKHYFPRHLPPPSPPRLPKFSGNLTFQTQGSTKCNVRCFLLPEKRKSSKLDSNHLSSSSDGKHPFEIIAETISKALNALKKPAIAAVLLGLLLMYDPNNAALAASGGRMGGRSFSSSSSSSRSYSVPRNGGSRFSSYSVPYYAPAPFGGGGGFYMGPAVGVGVGAGSSFFLILIGFAAFVLVSGFLSDRSESSVLTASERTSVLKLQVDAKRSIDDGEKRFNQLSIEERGKFDEETLVNVNNIKRQSTTSRKASGFSNEYIVITILVAAEGLHKLPPINGSRDLKEALQKLASIPTSKILAVEVLWTPQNENDTLSERELLEDYPLLRPL